MSAAKLIEAIRSAGGMLTFQHGKLLGKGIAPEHRDLIWQHKREIINLLKQMPGDDAVSYSSPQRTTNRRISPPALSWLRAHRVELRKAGWTAPELWRRNKSRGIAWLSIWNKPGLKITLEPSGSVVFRFTNELGKPIQQTAWPVARAPYIKGND